MSVTAMQNFRGVPSVTPQDDEAAFWKSGTGLVDIYELADALRVMGKSERDIQQLLKELVAPFPQQYSHNADVHDVPDVKSTGLVDKQELADAWREMGTTERENQQLLDELNLEKRKKMILPSPLRYFHNVNVPVVGSRDTVPKMRKARSPRSKLPLCWHGAQVAASSDTVGPKNVSTQGRGDQG